MPRLNLDSLERDDFKKILSDIGEWVIYYAPNKTLSNIEGDEIIAEDTGKRVFVNFQINDRNFFYDREGIIENGDATVHSKASDNLIKDGKIKRNGERFEIRSVITRHNVDICSLFRWDSGN